MIRSVGALVLLAGVVCGGDLARAEAADPLARVNFAAMRLAIRDLAETFPQQYVRSKEYLRRLDRYERRLPAIRRRLQQGDEAALREAREILTFRREVLLSNPLLDFDRLLVIKRKPDGDSRRPKGENYGLGQFLGLPRQSSWQQDTIPKRDGWENEIAVLSGLRGEPKSETLFEPSTPRLVGDVELHYDAGKILFSMPDEDLLWQVFEIDADGSGLRQLTPRNQPGIHNFDACYLPNGKIAYASTAPLQGVPCNAAVNVAMTYLMDADGKNFRQLCFDQDHNYCLTVTNDGRILYLRWEYTDIPHVWGRYLFTMNPDGTNQREFYGSGGYWPNGIFYARPIPEHPTMFVGIVTGHHVGRVGELVLFDPARGRNAVEGVIQRIPERGGKVEPLIEDRLTEESWPKFLHPYPLNDKYFIVSAKPTPDDLWGIYLADAFDNLVLLKEVEGYALMEPIPFRKRETPPVIPEKVNLRTRDALIYLEDVYEGPGLQAVPRGMVKELRLFTYHFAYQRIAGINHRVGADGPWEPKQMLGTVPVEEDGSAMFRVPANTPISIQPIDSQGRALQLMRSWTTAMPGEIVSCVGCHEKQNSTPPSRDTIAAKRTPSSIEPWRGPARGFSFAREVQPVLDEYCVGCHDGAVRGDGWTIPDLSADQGKFVVLRGGDPEPRVIAGESKEELFKKWGGVFEPSYFELRRFVRVGGFESDIRLLDPGEFHVNTCELIQMLSKGHHGVELDEEAWDRLYVWIDLNAPCHGTWRETTGVEKTRKDHLRRIKLLELYANIDGKDPEAVVEVPRERIHPVIPESVPEVREAMPQVAGWPFDAEEAVRRQKAAGPARRTIDLGAGVKLQMVLVPAGRFAMGDPQGHPDERPVAAVHVDKPFWMGKFEITNAQFARFDPTHDSRFEHKGSWVFWEHHLGWPLNRPEQPVVRVSRHEAEAFCSWLSGKIGEKVTLPSEAQWEYACRAGSATPFSFGGVEADFAPFANMADATIRQLAYDTDGRHTADLTPRETRFDDKSLVTADVGRYRPNAWGLHDMHGNVWEWTRSAYGPYPYRADDGRHDPARNGGNVVRGGSWRDRPKLCRSAFRLSYPAWQKVYNVGFRVVCEVEETPELVRADRGGS